MTDRNEKNELNEQELEQVAGGVSDQSDVIFRCFECNTAKRVTAQESVIAPTCDKCHKQMVKSVGYQGQKSQAKIKGV